MIKMLYNYRDIYTPSTSISNTLTAGTTGLDETTLTITDKKYLNISDVIYQVQNAGTYNIVFSQCLFYRCDNIFKALLGFGSVTFSRCTFIECDKITDTWETLGSTITIEKSIIYRCSFILTYNTLNITDCIYTLFYGATGLVNYTDSYIDNPLFLYEIDSSYDIGVLMSKSRGFKFNSPALLEEQSEWTTDAGCYIETRGVLSNVNDSVEFSNICDSYKKNIFLPDFKKFINENGQIIQIWNYNREQKYINISWNNNGLKEDEMQAIITMQKMKNTKVRFYPDSVVTTKYVEGTLNKVESIDISKNASIFYENRNNGTDLVNYKGVVMSILVTSEVGTWQT